MKIEKDPTTGKVLELFIPAVELPTSPQETQRDFCILRGIISHTVLGPLHAHPNAEDFFYYFRRIGPSKTRK